MNTQKRTKIELKRKEFLERKARVQKLEQLAKTFVLPTRAGDYVSSVNKKLSDYRLRWVMATVYPRSDYFDESTGSWQVYITSNAQITEEGLQEGAEVIVDTCIAGEIIRGITLYGTALIPKNKMREGEKNETDNNQ